MQEEPQEYIDTAAFYDERSKLVGKRRCAIAMYQGWGPKWTLLHSINIRGAFVTQA